ncbi:hypothetical protein B0F90DRAFT_1669440 [Multifurca ochricompacta]|uniref:Uncharacterized protein n=1 Tax=Multifurca ochricompacta TaxID=376703 RepID=A0AAD4M240_9AGAM|nr:hypothetical protein B0F90DRAFT_1669440 [Multifurca ochricompacta]
MFLLRMDVYLEKSTDRPTRAAGRRDAGIDANGNVLTVSGEAKHSSGCDEEGCPIRKRRYTAALFSSKYGASVQALVQAALPRHWKFSGYSPDWRSNVSISQLIDLPHRPHIPALSSNLFVVQGLFWQWSPQETVSFTRRPLIAADWFRRSEGRDA